MKTKPPFTPEERLTLYKKALSDYREPGIDNKRYCGLCMYFDLVHEINTYHKMGAIFPELEKASLLTRESDIFWWRDGVKAPRIKCLEKAIKILKQSKS